MLGHFQFKQVKGRILLTNDLGCYCFLESAQFRDMICGGTVADAAKRQELTEKGFLYEGSREAYIQRSMSRLRGMKSYLFQATSLHIFVVTTACNGNCCYCQARSRHTGSGISMDLKTARAAVEIALSSPAQELSFEFQGGEPLMHFGIIREIVNYTEQRVKGKHVTFNIVSNLTLLDAEMLAFIRQHDIRLSTSLDGPEEVHDRNRPYLNGSGMYGDVILQLEKLREIGLSVGAIETTTRHTLPHARALIDTYITQELHSIFLRPLTPLGTASEQWEQIGYSPEEFGAFYRECLLYILEKNKAGYPLQEGHARLFLRKILSQYADNYMDLRSPCGAVTGQLAYYPDGSIYTCDEGRMLSEMGDSTFYLGNVWTSDYASLTASPVCRAVCKASVTESLIRCSDCVYQPYCGVCPVINHAQQNDLLTPSDYRCRLFRSILDTLFALLEEESNLQVFCSWI